MEVTKERKGFEDHSNSDSDDNDDDDAHARVNEEHPQGRKEVSQNTNIFLPERIAFVEEYLANLQETYSITTETTDSGLGSQRAISELELYKSTGNCIAKSCCLLE